VNLEDPALVRLLADERDVTLGRTPAGPVLYRRNQLLATRMTAPAAAIVFGDDVADREDLDDLGVVRLWLRPQADALALWQTRRRLVSPVHVFTPLLALAGAAAVDAVRSWLTVDGLFIDQIEFARLLGSPGRPVRLMPLAGPTVDDRPPAAVRLPAGMLVVAPAGDQASARPMYPAALPGVLAVAAIDMDRRELTPTSGWGDWVDVTWLGDGPVPGTAAAAAAVAAIVEAMPPPVNVAGAVSTLARTTGILRERRVLRLEDGTAETFAWPELTGDDVLRLAEDERWERDRWVDDDVEDSHLGLPGPTLGGEHLSQPPPSAGQNPRTAGGYGRGEAGRHTDRGDAAAEPIPAERAKGGHWLVGTRLMAPGGDPMPRDECLVTATTYEVQLMASRVPPVGTLEDVPVPLSMQAAPPGTPVEMVVQPLGGGLTVVGPAAVAFALGDEPGGTLRIHTPDDPGRYRMRCLLYSIGSLLQARLITVEVRERPTLLSAALRVEVDFSVATTLDGAYLDGLEPVTLSIFVNSSDGGDTHDIVYRGGEGIEPVTGSLSVSAGEVSSVAHLVRARLRRISWGSDQPWEEKFAPRYGAGRPDTAQFFRDLQTLALAGYRLWGALFPELARLADQEFPTRKEIRELLGRPGAIELSARDSLKLSLPASFIYDYPLRETPAAEICPDFAAAYAARDQLLTQSCFLIGCRHGDDEGYFCPSGFWGLRHQVSLVRSVAGRDPEMEAARKVLRGGQRGEAVSIIEVDDTPTGIAAATTDPRFTGRLAHLERLEQLFTDRLTITERRDEALTLMSAARDHVVYFFCHGIRTPDNYPGLVIGAVNDIPITQSTFGEYVRWRRTRPLVFVNGCETAALEPDSAYTLVGALVRECGAAGVIGTETTVFEPTATRFAEVFHAAFLTEWYTVAEALRRARLALLEDGNPLGLGYTAYAPVALRLEARRQAGDPPPHR
jgi:hypothetical protein